MRWPRLPTTEIVKKTEKVRKMVKEEKDKCRQKWAKEAGKKKRQEWVERNRQREMEEKHGT